jgi:DNA modification methylase
MSHRVADGKRIKKWGMDEGSKMGKSADGTYKAIDNPSRKDKGVARAAAVANGAGRKMSARDSDERGEWNYVPPSIANPGNLLKTNVGGGQMGHALAHENEAPYPEEVPEFFIRSLCPPKGLVCDPFSGSGTTLAAAERCDRRGIGLDLRASQAVIARQRLDRPHAPVQRPGKPEHHPLFPESA